MIKKYFYFLALVLLLFSCRKQEDVVTLNNQYINSLEQERENKDREMMQGSDSPFNRDSTAKFEPLKYYKPTAEFIFKSKLHINDKQNPVTIYGTRGEARKAITFGYVVLNYKGKDYKLNVYKNIGHNGQSYYSVWFTDRTTGKETYPVGRYLDFELNANPEYIYTLDFNRAYNPYCAYSDLYTCAIPTKEDYLDFEIKAGEKNFHSKLNTETK